MGQDVQPNTHRALCREITDYHSNAKARAFADEAARAATGPDPVGATVPQPRE